MERSIENIWKEGFIDNEALIAPKVNDLYNRKSKHIMDRIQGKFKLNIILLYSFAVIMLINSFIVQTPFILGAILVLLFVVPAIYSQRKYRKRDSIHRYTNSYEYLKNFNSWLKNEINTNTVLARFYYPIAILATAAMIWYANGRVAMMEKILEQYPDLPMLWNIPVYFLVPVLAAALLISLFAGKVYRFDVRLLYGRVFEKLDELIRDFEELRQ